MAKKVTAKATPKTRSKPAPKKAEPQVEEKLDVVPSSDSISEATPTERWNHAYFQPPEPKFVWQNGEYVKGKDRYVPKPNGCLHHYIGHKCVKFLTLEESEEFYQKWLKED